MELMYGTNEQGECGLCDGKRWMTLQPMNFVAPCVGCSGDRSLPDIEKERGVKLFKNSMGEWTEIKLN